MDAIDTLNKVSSRSYVYQGVQEHWHAILQSALKQKPDAVTIAVKDQFIEVVQDSSLGRGVT